MITSHVRMPNRQISSPYFASVFEIIIPGDYMCKNVQSAKCEL